MKKLLLLFSLLSCASIGAQNFSWQSIKEKVLTKKVLAPTAKIAAGALLTTTAALHIFNERALIENQWIGELPLYAESAGILQRPIHIAITQVPLVGALGWGMYLMVDGVIDVVKELKSKKTNVVVNS